MPKDYATSVGPTYGRYVAWTMAGSVASTMTGVLSMQALLIAMGAGAGAVPLAATLNWILKDGLGQFGGIIFASFVNQRFDADPRRWRFAAALALDAAVVLEVLTPLVPHLFLPMAGLANVGKNVAWLSASATRAGINHAFTLRENLGDVTAKSGSQSIVASLVGTGAAVLLSPQLGCETVVVLPVVLALSSVHLFCVHRGLAAVVMPTLNRQRAWLALRDDLKSAIAAPAAETPFQNLRSIRRPDEVAREEAILAPPQMRGGGGGGPAVIVGPSFERFVGAGAGANELQPALERRKRYCGDAHLVRALPEAVAGRTPSIALLLCTEASPSRVLLGYVHAALAAESLRCGRFCNTDDALEWAREALANLGGERDEAEMLSAALRDAGWDVENLFLEDRRARITITES